MNTGVDYFSPIHDKMPFQKPQPKHGGVHTFLGKVVEKGRNLFKKPESGKSKLEKVVFLVQIDFFFYLK